jgi:RHS repeat-associated protein
MTFAVFTSRTGTLGTTPATATRYMHQDNLGSVVTVTDETGATVERFSYDPWGKRRNVNGTPDTAGTLVGASTDRGYTLHEHIDEMGLINMNGRVYDPVIGRFMSADPFVQSMYDTQAYNRYAYVSNNPLLYTDPSGYIKWKKIFKAIAAIAIGVFAPQIFATYGFSVAAISAPVAQGINAVAAGALSGAVSTGSLKGALQGALTAGLFNWAGGVGDVADPSRYMAHAVAGCVSSAASGNNCSS